MGSRGNIQCYAITCLKGEELTLSIFQEYRDEMNHIFSRYIYRGFVDFRKCNCLAFDMIKLIEKATEELPKLGKLLPKKQQSRYLRLFCHNAMS